MSSKEQPIKPQETVGDSAFPSYVENYQEHAWKKYPMAAEELKTIREITVSLDPEFVVCDSESEQAKKIKDQPQRIYRDIEMMAADFDATQGGDFCKLKVAWQDHPAGSLVMIVYKGIMERPPTMTVCVAE